MIHPIADVCFLLVILYHIVKLQSSDRVIQADSTGRLSTAVWVCSTLGEQHWSVDRSKVFIAEASHERK